MDQANSGVFINGKAQVVEMLKFMPEEERNRLIKNIQMKNPQLAQELMAQSLGFDHIQKLNEHEIGLVIEYIAAPIMGVALKDANVHTQKKILSSVPRAYAEEAYKMMITPLRDEKKDILRAQEKVIRVMIALNKRNQLNLQ